jgi:gas vesicle protein
MDMQSFRKDALETMARRSLDMLRELDPSHLRQLAMATFRPRPSPIVPIATAIGGLVVGAAIGAGITLFVTPVSGPQMRKRVATQGRRARARAMELSHDAGQAIEDQITSASTALGISAPKTKAKRAARVVTNGHNKRHTSRPTHASA